MAFNSEHHDQPQDLGVPNCLDPNVFRLYSGQASSNTPRYRDPFWQAQCPAEICRNEGLTIHSGARFDRSVEAPTKGGTTCSSVRKQTKFGIDR